MSEARVILCPGQGAQALGMGRAWREASPAARAVFDKADALLGNRLGAPLSRLCFEGPAETLNRTDVAQPALFTAGVACFRALEADHGWSGGTISAAEGLSLGESTALHLAGAFSFEDGLELVALRGRAMQDSAEAVDSGMLALIGADESQARAVCAAAAEGQALVPANFNAPGQIVLSGHVGACERALKAAEGMGLKATRLAVAGAFHSPLMAPAAERLGPALEKVAIAAPRCPVMSNVTGRPHGEGGDGSGTAERSIRRRLVEQLTAPVRWDECCRWLAANATAPMHEMAPGRVLAGLMRRIDRNVKVESHDAP